MKILLWLLSLSGYTLVVHASIKPLQTIVANPGGIGGIFKGPDSETIIHGPDGSVITSEERGGVLQTDSKLQPIVVADELVAPAIPAAPLLVQEQLPIVSTVATPIEPVITGTVVPILSTNPVKKIDIVEPDPHIIETEIVDAPDVESKESTDLVGPSGSISTRGSESIVSGPASTTITKTAKVLVAPPKISLTVPLTVPIHPVPAVEVNNELPVSPISTLNIGEVPLSVTAAPPVIEHVSSIAPPLSIGPTIAPSLHGSSLAPQLPIGTNLQPQLSINSNLAPQQSLIPNNQQILINVGSSTAAPLSPVKSINSYEVQSTVSSTLAPQDISIVSSKEPAILRIPGLSVGPEIPLHSGPRLLSTPVVSSTPGAIGLLPENNGVNVIDDGSSGYLRPDIQSTTISNKLGPNLLEGEVQVQNVPQQWLVNRHLVVDPANIPQRNIVPPEINTYQQQVQQNIYQSEVNAPQAPGLLSSTNPQYNRNIQSDIVVNQGPVERTFQNGYYQNEILLGNPEYSRQPSLSNTNPIPANINVPAGGILENELNKAQIDSSQIQLTNVPLTDVTGLQSGRESEPRPQDAQDYDDRASASLWNRYGRRTRNRKY